MIKDKCSSTHPPLPTTTEDDSLIRLRLLRSRKVGPATYRRLIAEHGTATAALNALPDMARAAGIDDYYACPENVAISELRAGSRVNARLVFQGDPVYPNALNDIPDAPIALWMVGDAAHLTRPMVALIGARTSSSLGTRMARKLASELGEAGYTVVSGLARGIDTAAHTGALTTGTIAVLAGGVDILYPPKNAELARDIGTQGLRLSDQPIGLQPRSHHFIARNRIISGLACATVVVEAAAKSGSLSCAQGALDQGRDVFAVPGHPFDARVAGCNMLIRDGATLVRGAQDIIDQLGDLHNTSVAPELPLESSTPSKSQDVKETADLHTSILDQLAHAPVVEDQLIRSLGVAATAIAPILMDLELDGQIIRQAGGIIARTT